MNILLTSICMESATDVQLALFYLKSYLLKTPHSSSASHDVSVKLFYEYQKNSRIVSSIRRLKPCVIGFSCYIWNIRQTLQVCKALKKTAPHAVIVLGGPEVSPRAEEILESEPAVTAVVRGEGEETFSRLIEAVSRNCALSGITGLSFRLGRSIVHNPDRPPLADIGVIPSPYLTGAIDLTDKNIVDVPLETMRGCSYRCSYCYYHKNFPRVRYFPLERVRRELRLILSHKPKAVYLMDATFNSDLPRVKKILRVFIKYNRGSSLHVELKAELVDEELAALLRKANAFTIEIGIQSTKQKTLRAINRVLNKDAFARGIRLLNKYRVYYEIQLIDALPYQGYDDIKRSLDWLYSLEPVKVVVLRLSVLAGTSLRGAAGRFGIEYERKAPYYAVRNSVMTPRDMEKIEALRFALTRVYDSQVFQKTLFALRDKAGLRISDVLDDWILWERRFKRRPEAYPDFLNKRSPDFLAYTLRRRGKYRWYKVLLPGLLESLAGVFGGDS